MKRSIDQFCSSPSNQVSKKYFFSAPEPDMNEFCFVAEEIAETFMKAKDAHLLIAQDCFEARLWAIDYGPHRKIKLEKNEKL